MVRDIERLTEGLEPYGVGLRQLADKYPRLIEPLIRAELNRTIRLKAWTNSEQQLAACDEILVYLNVVAEYFREKQPPPSAQRVGFSSRLLSEARFSVPQGKMQLDILEFFVLCWPSPAPQPPSV